MLKNYVELLTITIELAGVAIILGGLVRACLTALKAGIYAEKTYDNFKGTLGRSILLGLELLVAGDIINTVAVDPSLESVTILGCIVLIRTFLSFSLEIELEGQLPWRKQKSKNDVAKIDINS